MNKRIKPVGLAVGAAFSASMTLAASTAAADTAEGLFAATDLGAGYDLLAAKEEAEGKCGEGKCGEGKCGEGKCGEGKCGEDKGGEGKCGEGKCGGTA